MQLINTLFIVPSLKRAGAEAQVVDLVNTISDSTFQPFLLTFDSELDQLERVDQDRVYFRRLEKRKKIDINLARDIARVIDEENIGMIHCTLQYSLLVAMLALRYTSSKPMLLVSIHTTINRSWKEELFDRFIYRYMFRKCARLLFVCNNQKTYWINKYPELESRSSVVYNGVDPSRFDVAEYQTKRESYRAELGIPEDATVFSSIAGFRPEKGQHLLVNALSKCGDTNAYLVFAGEGPCKIAVEELVHEKGMDGKVRFLGKVADVRPLLSISDAMVLPSTSVETFSIAMLEAMAMEVPVIGSDIGGMSEAVIPDETGYLVEPGNIESLQRALLHFIDNKRHSEQLGKQAREKVIREFSVEKMARETEAVMKEVLIR